MNKIYIIGAGQLGSRHLQALKAVKKPLKIFVVDPSKKSLLIAEQRYNSISPKKTRHEINYLEQIPEQDGNIDIAILATNSNVRREVIEKLLVSCSKIKYLILEKLLFQKKKDYLDVQKILTKNRIRAWVNCPMRMMPFYGSLKNKLCDKQLFYRSSGSQFGLVTTAIHYLDHLAYLTDCSSFKVDTSLLDANPILSKRKGFLEFNGTLQVKFENGSMGIFSCYGKGEAPVVVEIASQNFRCITKETESRAWISGTGNNWKWQEIKAPMPYQSQMTVNLVGNLLKSGKCQLPSYKESIKIHLPLLEALLKHLNKYSKKKYDYYPFT